MHLNRRGNSLFSKNLLGFMKQNWNCKCKGHVNIYSEDVTNVSHSDEQQILKDIRKSNVNKLVFGQLNINSLRNKFDMLSELIQNFVDVFMISETKLDESFHEGQFFTDGYHTPFRYDLNGNGGGILLYVREDIPAKVIQCDFPTSESFLLKLIFVRKNGW